MGFDNYSNALGVRIIYTDNMKHTLDYVVSGTSYMRLSNPNIALDDVPVGKDEKMNKEIKKIGEITKFNFKPLAHDQLGKKNNMMD